MGITFKPQLKTVALQELALLLLNSINVGLSQNQSFITMSKWTTYEKFDARIAFVHQTSN